MTSGPVYSSKDEQLLMQKLWSRDIADDPEKFVMFAFPWGVANTPLAGFKGPRKWQKEVLRRLAEHIKKNKNPDDLYKAFRMATASGRGIGKSALVCWLIIWMLTTRIGSSVIVSANSEHQLRSVTWGELAKWVAMAINSHWWDISATKLTPGAWITALVERDLKKGTRYWTAEGKLWSEENPDAYAGTHNYDGTMVIFDEASGIPDGIWSVAAGFFTENIPDRYWFAFSNPRKNTGYFFECFDSKADFWITDQIDARTVEGTDKSIYQQIIDEYGGDSKEARVEVYGEFPNTGDDQFIPPSLVEEAFQRERYDDDTAPIIIGVDPARGGDDTVIVVRKGRDLLKIMRSREQDTMETVGIVIEAIQEWKPSLTIIDEGGVGAGVFDRLKEQNYMVRGVNFGWKSKNPKMYLNKRAELWGEMREWIKGASIPKDKLLKRDLCIVKQKHTSSGAIQLEGKKEIKSKGKISPDSADALAVTFAYTVAPIKKIDREPRKIYSGRNNASWMAA